MKAKINIAVVDDHKLFRKGLINLIHSLDSNFFVSIEANNGEELFDILKSDVQDVPDVILLDVNMPVLDGQATAKILQHEYPKAKVLVVTMNNDEDSLIKMLRSGVHGYINKDIEPYELKHALDQVIEKGYHYTDVLTGQLIKTLNSGESMDSRSLLTDQELTFVKLACSEDTYSQIADKMFLSPKTIDGYRASVFEKLSIKSRVGLAIYAIRNGLVS